MISRFAPYALVAASALVLAGCSAESKKARMLERAAEYYRKGETEKARIEYQNVLQKNPDDPTANEKLAIIWYDRGATMMALSFLSKMQTLAPGDLNLRVKRAQLIASIGRPAEARREAQAILERSSAIAEAVVLLTETIRDGEDFKAVDAIVQKFPERNTVQFHLATANLSMLRGDVDAAKAAIQRALTVDPKSPPAHAALAGLYAAQRNTTQALEEFKKASELSTPRSPERLKYAGYLAQIGSMPQAIAVLTEVTKQAPDFQPAWRGLAQFALAERRFDDALNLLQSVLLRDGTDVEAALIRARVWQAKGDTKRAIEDLKKIGEAFPGLGLEKQQLAMAYLQDGDHPKTIETLRQVLGANPANVEALLLLTQLNLQAGNHQEAANAMSALISRRPDLPQSYPLLVEAAKGLGKLDNLVQTIQENITKFPKNGQLHYTLGLILTQQQKLAEARQSFQKSAEVSPDSTPPLVELVALDLREKKYTSALQTAQGIATRFPKLPVGHILVARSSAALGKWDDAEAAAVKALEVDATSTAALGVLADAFSARKGQAGLEARLDAIVTPRVTQPLIVILGGQVYLQLDRPEKARDLYEKHLLAKPNSAVICNNLANLYAEKLNKPDRALELARKARELEPSGAAFADTLGWILYQRKDYKEALPHLEEAAKALADNPEVQYHLGMVQLKLGRNEAAATALQRAASSTAEFAGKDEAKRELAKLPAPAQK